MRGTNLVRFGAFCRMAHINRTELFMLINNRCLSVTVIHGVSFLCSDNAAIRAAQQNLGLRPIQEMKNAVQKYHN